MAQAKRKKKFFEIDIPLIKRETYALAFEEKELHGKLMRYDLTRMLKGKSTILQVETVAKEKEVTSKPRSLTLLPYYLKKMVRKGTNYVEDSFSAECRDAQIRIKPFLITRRKVSRAVRKALRNEAKKELIEYAKTKTAEEIFKDILKNILQKRLGLKLKKIYPLSLSEIRVLKVEKEFEDVAPKPKEAKEEKSEEEKIEEKVEEEIEKDLERQSIPEEVAKEESEDMAEDIVKEVTKKATKKKAETEQKETKVKKTSTKKEEKEKTTKKNSKKE